MLRPYTRPYQIVLFFAHHNLQLENITQYVDIPVNMSNAILLRCRLES